MPVSCQDIEQTRHHRYPPICENVGHDGTRYYGSALDRIRASTERSIYWQIGQQFEEIDAELDRVSRLQDGWDSYHASAPSPGAIDLTKQLLRLLRAAMLPPDRVAPSAEGGVGICFVDADKYADLEIFNDLEILATAYRGKSEPRIWEVSTAVGSLEDAIRRIREHLNS
jgi:hypothetical protein